MRIGGARQRWHPKRILCPRPERYTLYPQKAINSPKVDPQWSRLKAVKNNDDYPFPQDIFGWDQSEPRWILGMTWLGARMDPDRFRDVDKKAEVMAYFSELDGMSQADIKSIIASRAIMDAP